MGLALKQEKKKKNPPVQKPARRIILAGGTFGRAKRFRYVRGVKQTLVCSRTVRS